MGLNTMFGDVPIGLPMATWRSDALLDHVRQVTERSQQAQQAVVQRFRLPRVLAGAGVGSVLVAGVLVYVLIQAGGGELGCPGWKTDARGRRAKRQQ